jgi:hypothetical protein
VEKNLTAEDARRMIEQDRKERNEAALKEIQAVLAKYQCELAGVPSFTPDGRIVVRVQIVARPESA